MYDKTYEFDYDKIVEDTDELYDYANYSDEPDYEAHWFRNNKQKINEHAYDCYYHDVMDELDTE